MSARLKFDAFDVPAAPSCCRSKTYPIVENLILILPGLEIRQPALICSAASAGFASLLRERAENAFSRPTTTGSASKPTRRILAKSHMATFTVSLSRTSPHTTFFARAFLANRSVSPEFQKN